MQAKPVEGFAIAPNWMVRDPNITTRAKVVFLVLASHTGRDGTWWISHQQIATESGVSVSTVKRALSELRDLGLVSWEQRTQSGGLVENAYRVNVTGGPVKLSGGSAHPRPNPPLTSDLTLRSPVSEQEEEPQEEPQELTATYGGGAAEPLPGLDAPAPQALTVVPDAPKQTPAQALVAEWLDHCTARPPSRVVGQVARELGALIREGIPYDAVRQGLGNWHTRSLHPSALASVVNEVLNPPTATRQRPTVATGTSRALAAYELAAQYREQEAQEGAGRAEITDRVATR